MFSAIGFKFFFNKHFVNLFRSWNKFKTFGQKRNLIFRQMAFRQIDNVRTYKFTFISTIWYCSYVRWLFQRRMILCFLQSYFVRVNLYFIKLCTWGKNLWHRREGSTNVRLGRTKQKNVCNRCLQNRERYSNQNIIGLKQSFWVWYFADVIMFFFLYMLAIAACQRELERLIWHYDRLFLFIICRALDCVHQRSERLKGAESIEHASLNWSMELLNSSMKNLSNISVVHHSR